MRLFAISDLHLSTTGEKPMDVFGPVWENHQEKIRNRWLATVGVDDTVLVAGDISWGLRFEEALPDLQWLAALPGTKVLVRGNHDYWWSSKKSAARLQALLPPTLVPLHKTSHIVQVHGLRVGIAGSRGWPVPPESAEDAKIIAVEEQRLRASLSSLPEELDVRIGMIHIPPFTPEGQETTFVTIFREAGVSQVIYGHVHGPDSRAFEGRKGGVLFRNVAVDHVNFCPVRLL